MSEWSEETRLGDLNLYWEDQKTAFKGRLRPRGHLKPRPRDGDSQ